MLSLEPNQPMWRFDSESIAGEESGRTPTAAIVVIVAALGYGHLANLVAKADDRRIYPDADEST